jgi:hypothetical protein
MAKHSKRRHPGLFEFNPARLTTSLVCERKSAKDPRIQQALDLLQQNYAPQSHELSHCTWGITTPHLESTVAALAFNRLAQETFEKHECAAHPLTEPPC